jgi:Phage integrase family
VRIGNWLTPEQARALVEAPTPETPRGKRDRAILGVLLGCGLRRSELVHLKLGDVQQREGRWAIVDLVGKGGHVRKVPVPGWVKSRIDEWTQTSGIASGRVFRSINKSGVVWGNGLTERVVWYVVKNFAKTVGIEKVAPHDLRRTCTRLCHVAGGELEQIQFLLGHVSVQTTERYRVFDTKTQLSLKRMEGSASIGLEATLGPIKAGLVELEAHGGGKAGIVLQVPGEVLKDLWAQAYVNATEDGLLRLRPEVPCCSARVRIWQHCRNCGHVLNSRTISLVLPVCPSPQLLQHALLAHPLVPIDIRGASAVYVCSMRSISFFQPEERFVERLCSADHDPVVAKQQPAQGGDRR